jgi:hypothetical protein
MRARDRGGVRTGGVTLPDRQVRWLRDSARHGGDSMAAWPCALGALRDLPSEPGISAQLRIIYISPFAAQISQGQYCADNGGLLVNRSSID